MAYLGKYIQQILTRQEPVALPGFGSLIVITGKGEPGADGKIDPPGLVLKFDATHPKDDGKLAKEYADEEGIELKEAHQQVLELVDAIKFKLDKGEKFYLEELGEFSRDDDNKVHFMKGSDWVLDPEGFGLESLELLELDDAETSQKEEKPTVTAEIEKEKPQTKTSIPKPKMKKNVAVRKPVNKWNIIWIVVAGLIAVLVVILLIPSGNNGIEFGNEGIVIRDTSGEEQPVDTRKENVEPEEKVLNETSMEKPVEEGADSQSEQAVNENRYFIIAGSFQNLVNATEMKKELETSGFKAEIIYTENRMYRVSIESFQTKQEAVNNLNRVRNASGVTNAWVMTR